MVSNFARAGVHAAIKGRSQQRKSAFDIRDYTRGLFSVPVRYQPARAFRNPEPHQEYQAGKPRAYQESEPPAKVGVDDIPVKQNK